jgi:glycosyltransferase involved in cell wall biosynthesis
MNKLSVVIITFNEERNLERCLQSVQGVADEVVVVDSFSSDRTAHIAAQYNTRFIQLPWQGYALSKNAANNLAVNPWILSLDADEALSPSLRKSILQWKTTPGVDASFARLTNYCGSWIKHCGWYPDTKHRIFHKEQTYWGGLIHERLIRHDNQESKPQLLAGDCLHYSYYNQEDHYKQAEKFVKLMAQDAVEKGRRFYYVMRWLSPVIKWIQMYVFKQGFMDGMAGWHVCRISAWAAYRKHVLGYEMQQKRK